jgi:hypothetical protein
LTKPFKTPFKTPVVDSPVTVEQRQQPDDDEVMYVEAGDNGTRTTKPAFIDEREELVDVRPCEHLAIVSIDMSLMNLVTASPFDLPDVNVDLDVSFSQKIDVHIC